jgi:tetratricopeptide (TPR) repeat protein
LSGRSGHPRPPAATVIEEFSRFVQAETWADSRRWLEEHPELLGQEALQVLHSWVISINDPEAAWTYRYHYGLLEACRLMGIAGMFDNFIPASGPAEGVAVPPAFEDDLRRLAGLDEAAERNPADHRDRIKLLEDVLRRLEEHERPSFRTALLINLAQAYAQLPQGDPATNLRKAASCLSEASQFVTPKTAPPQYAASQDALGVAYSELAGGDLTANLEKAIGCFTEALRFRSPDYAPLDHAETQNNLGSAYARLPTGDRAANLRRAIACFTEALRVLTREDAAPQRAIVQRNRALATTQLDRVLRGSH